MAWANDGSSPDPADVLRALIRARGLTARGLAKELAGGDTATEKEWDSKRRVVTLWLKGRRRGGSDPDDKSLDELAAALEVPAYLLTLLYRHHDREERIRVQAEELLRALGASTAPRGS